MYNRLIYHRIQPISCLCCCCRVWDQVNPAVTLSLLATRRLDVPRALLYIAIQCLGASLAAGALYLALPIKTTADHFVNKVSFPNTCVLLCTVFLSIPVVFVIFLLSSGAVRFECRPGSGHWDFVHLPDGLYHLLSGGSTSEGVYRTRKPGHWISTHCWSANRGRRSFTDSIMFLLYINKNVKV